MNRMKRNPGHILILSMLLWAVIAGCNPEVALPVKIAVTRSSTSYETWLSKADTSVQLINLYGVSVDSALTLLAGCHGLLITGGEDVFPGYYNQAGDTTFCDDFDHYRDSLEMGAIRLARKLQMPIFGVCRGLQILNVEAGGTLTADLPSMRPSAVSHRCDDWKNCFHQVVVDSLSQLFVLTQQRGGTVNSNHHQAIDHIGKGLMVTAWSADSVPEAIEANPLQYQGYLMAVQWHPERLHKNPSLSQPLASSFLKQAIIYHNKTSHSQRINTYL